MKRLGCILAGLILYCCAGAIRAYPVLQGDKLQISGDVSVTFREFDKHSRINANFRGDDPFSVFRVRTFFTRQWSDDISLFAEFLWDEGANPRVNGIYLLFRNVAGPFNAKVGMFGSPFGNYAYRSSYFNQNPLIGLPAMWHYITPLACDGSSTNESLMTKKTKRNSGIPIGYDTCWDKGIELFGSSGILEFSGAVTLRAHSNPRAYNNDGYQLIGKLGVAPVTGMRVGMSTAWAPWIRRDNDILLPDDLESYKQLAIGDYLEYQFGHWQLFSEGIWIEWETPFVHEGKISAMSAYIDARWTFLPGWHIGTRYDYFDYNKIARLDDGTGGEEKWGHDFHRFELGLGWRLIREGYIRLDYQHTAFIPDGVDAERIVASQFMFAF